MIVLTPSLSAADARAELAAIRAAGEGIISSQKRRRAFLAAIGFNAEADSTEPKKRGLKDAAAEKKRGAL